MAVRAFALTWVFNSALTAAEMVLSREWNEWPWISRISALLLVPLFWFFAIPWCAVDASFRRICFAGGVLLLGLGLLLLLRRESTWESLLHGAFPLAEGVGLWLAAAVGRVHRVEKGDPTTIRHGDG